MDLSPACCPFSTAIVGGTVRRDWCYKSSTRIYIFKVFMCFFVHFVMLGMEPRTLHMLDKKSTTKLHPHSFLFLRQSLTIQLSLTLNSQSSCLHFMSAGITGVNHHTWISTFVCYINLSVYLKFMFLRIKVVCTTQG
jgi:hypothetical protein